MINIEKAKKDIVKALAVLDVEKAILFGSYAYGNPTDDSDLDLYVVTKDDYTPQNYNEKRKLVRKVSNSILGLREEFSIDLIVHTKKMEQEFVLQETSLSNDILTRGVPLL